MTRLPLDLSRLPSEALARATYFVLEASYEAGDSYALSTIEESEDDGGFAIHVGVPDRPAHNRTFTFAAFESAVAALADLKRAFPAAGMWLSTLEILVQIEGADVWRGVVEARAMLDPADADDEWNALKDALAERDANGTPIVADPHAHAVIAAVAARL